MKIQILLIFIIFGCKPIFSQNSIKMLNASPINQDKYKDYKGSPFLWKENKDVIVYDNFGEEYENIKGNYNGLESEFEIYQDGKFILLPHSTYPIIKVVDPENPLTLVGNVHRDLKNTYCIQHAKTENYFILEKFSAKKSKVKVQTPGKPTEFNRINSKTTYYLLYGNELIEFKIKKKKLIKVFGHKKEIKEYLKKNDMKIKKIEDVIQLFEFLDSKGWLNESK